MNRSTTQWSTGLAAAALIALPIAASAQTPTSNPQQQPPQQQTPQQQPTQNPPAQNPPATQQPTDPQTGAQPAAAGQVDAAAAKKHLSDARDSLSQLTSLPEAAKLQGDSRTQVSQLISNFNELITTQSNWRASYDKVDANLTALLGPDNGDPNAASAASGTAGAVGTSGSTAAGATTAGTSSLDPAIRAKLVDVRSHLKLFEQAAGGRSAEARPADSAAAMSPANATASTANPANPASNPAQTNPAQTTPAQPSAAGAVGTSGVSASPTANMSAGDQAKASQQVGNAEASKHLDAISAILSKSKTGSLTRAQTTELKKHVEELRKILQQQ